MKISTRQFPMAAIWAFSGGLICLMVIVIFASGLPLALHWPILLVAIGIWLLVMPAYRELSGVVFFVGLGLLLWCANILVAENEMLLQDFPDAIIRAIKLAFSKSPVG